MLDFDTATQFSIVNFHTSRCSYQYTPKWKSAYYILFKLSSSQYGWHFQGKITGHLDSFVEITHKALLMVWLRPDNHNCCFHFSSLSQHLISLSSSCSQERLGIFCSCLPSLCLSGLVNTSGATHRTVFLLLYSHSFLMFLMFGLTLHWHTWNMVAIKKKLWGQRGHQSFVF